MLFRSARRCRRGNFVLIPNTLNHTNDRHDGTDDHFDVVRQNPNRFLVQPTERDHHTANERQNVSGNGLDLFIVHNIRI